MYNWFLLFSVSNTVVQRSINKAFDMRVCVMKWVQEIKVDVKQWLFDSPANPSPNVQ